MSLTADKKMTSKNKTMLAMTLVCFTLAGVNMACSLFIGTCPEIPTSTLNAGTFLELSPVPNRTDGRLPRSTVKDWRYKMHPYQTAPDMRAEISADKKMVKVTYKRQGSTYVEHWKMGKIKQW